jgi:glycosyltransferase involved in cell wall biosynthesis
MPVSLLVFSRASFESVNRTPYRILAAQHGVAVTLVIPQRLQFADGSREPTEGVEETLRLVKLPLRWSSQARLEHFEGMGKVIGSVRPTHVLVENEPASLMTTIASHHASRTGAKVLALSCENLDRNYLAEAWDGVKRLRPKAAAAGLINQMLLAHNRGGVHRVLTLSRDGARVMERAGFTGRVTQTPLGFDPKIFHPQDPASIAATRKRLGLSRRTVAYFGRITPEKGVDLLIEALAGMMDREWDLLLDDFGDYRSPYLERMRGLLDSSGVARRTIFFRAPHADIATYMNAADIVVLPSVSTSKWKEQYGRVVPEAMACGKVVIGSDSGTIPELIGESGLIFPEKDVAALRKALGDALDMPIGKFEEVGAGAARRARALLGADTQARILFDLIRAPG